MHEKLVYKNFNLISQSKNLSHLLMNFWLLLYNLWPDILISLFSHYSFLSLKKCQEQWKISSRLNYIKQLKSEETTRRNLGKNKKVLQYKHALKFVRTIIKILLEIISRWEMAFYLNESWKSSQKVLKCWKYNKAISWKKERLKWYKWVNCFERKPVSVKSQQVYLCRKLVSYKSEKNL